MRPAQWLAELGVPGGWWSVLLLAGYALLFGVGVFNLVGGDSGGVVAVVAALAGAFLIERRVIHVAIWVVVALLGVATALGGQSLGFLQALGGLAGVGLALGRPSINPVAPAATVVNPPLSPAEELTARLVPQLAPPTPEGRLCIRTIGTLQILDGGKDLAPRLLRSRVSGFLWLYLLVRAIRSADDRPLKPQLADEMSPGLSASEQARRFRSQRHELKGLAAPLFNLVRDEGECIWIDLSDVDLDVGRLRRLRDRLGPRTQTLDNDSVKELEATLAAIPIGAFLPAWHEVENRVTGGRGTAGDRVNEVRLEVENLQADLIAALARAHLARGNPGRAIEPLDRALQVCTDREDLARMLIAACLETGQLDRAEAVRKKHLREEA
ncbi:MAG TPA: hypothetical protein VND98_06380 [Solirubrobacterales bacterium]|nr:hypothetical protein [Solirubrobacterales bacterium]